MIFYWSKPFIKSLATIFGAMYLWQFINLLTIIFWQVTFLPAKPFLFLGGAVLTISAAYGIGFFINEKIKSEKIRIGLFILGWLVLANQLLGGSFVDQPDTQKQLVTMKQPLRGEFVNLINNLKDVENIQDLTILSSGIPQISAYLPLDFYISYNIHFSHPAANFSERHLFISELASSVDSDSFYQKLINSPIDKVDALLFFKAEEYYPVIFGIDNYPSGVSEEEIKISKNLINEQYFVTVFEDEHFVFFKIKEPR